MIHKFVALLQEKFRQRLEAKTGWGKNEVFDEYLKAESDTLLQLLDEKVGALLNERE